MTLLCLLLYRYDVSVNKYKVSVQVQDFFAENLSVCMCMFLCGSAGEMWPGSKGVGVVRLDHAL